MTAASLII